MEQSKIDRINELSRKERGGTPLTSEEKAEQSALRRECIDGFKRSLRAQLDNIEIQK